MAPSNKAAVRQQSKRDLAKETMWRAHIEAWKKSGLSQPEFCMLNKLNKHTFQYWMRHIARGDSADARAASGIKRTYVRTKRSSTKAKQKAVEFVPIDVVQGKQEQLSRESLGVAEQRKFAFEIQTLKGFRFLINVDKDSLHMVLAELGIIPC